MAKTLSLGPNSTDVPAIGNMTDPVAPLHYSADFRVVEEGASKVVYTDVTAPLDRPATLRIAQTSRPNVYAGTSIDPSCFLPSKKGIDTIIEVREIWAETDDTDSTYLKLLPVRCAITLSVPCASQVTAVAVEHLVTRAFAALAAQGSDTMNTGVDALLRGIVKK